MFKCSVGIYGLPREVTAIRQVDIELQDGASLREVIAALREEIPALEGPVVRSGEDRLTERYTFNVNGRFYYDDGGDLRLHSGDRVALLSVATGR